ncbi:hypothetical protein [Psychromonas hadalis]|uniref:hypothetical protein n=1 Tax=Psychromonas hadalis TaxID=211669 RepID=UPI0003B3C338|nr:hypothetical protein [Psychromonas hadalis]
MRGQTKIINTVTDKQTAGISQADIIKQATINVRYDDAIYPDDYDHMQIKEGDEGYIEPIYRFEKEIDQGVLDRFEITL